MGNAIDLNARALWLSLRNQGGWWSAMNLMVHWSPTFSVDEVVAHLKALHRGGFVAEQEVSPHQVRVKTYAVTPLCRPLPGYDVPPQRRSI
jgi:hypothetical protein